MVAVRRNHSLGFTLVELLIVVGITAVLATGAVLVINPLDLLRQSKDSTRISDLGSINKAIALYRSDGGTAFGAANIVYVSIPDSSATCGNLGLPSLPTGWTYNCETVTDHRNTDGSGWLPIDLDAISAGAPFSALPVDPVNSTVTGNYYTYVTSGDAWELNTRLESVKLSYGGGQSKTSTDGGNNDYLYEVGSDLSLILDNENLIRDGDMERNDVTYWADYSYNAPPPVKVKDTTTAYSGIRSLHLTTADAGYEGTTQATVTTMVPTSGRVYMQMALKTAPGKALGWECACRTTNCCWFMLYSNSQSLDWKTFSTVRDISASTGLTRIYLSQPFGTASEFWIDDIIVRPVY